MGRQTMGGLVTVLAGLALAIGLTASPAAAQQLAAAPAAQGPASAAQEPALTPILTTPCGNQVAAPAALPPAGSAPFIWILEPCFPRQGNTSTIESETYMYWIKVRTSQTRQGNFIPYNETTEQTMLSDFKALWNTNFLEDLSIEVTEHTFENGVVGKILTYNMEERERVKIVDYQGSKQIDRTKIDEKLRERNVELRLDSFLDESVIRRVEGVLRSFMAEKGFTNAEVSHKITPVAGGPKLVNVTFNVSEGPKIKIRDIEFVGNEAISDGRLQRRLKENKPKGIISFITGSGTYKEAEYEADVERVVEYYQNRGYVRARVGQPELKTLESSKDGKTRWIQLRIPVTEGPRYRIGELDFSGNTLVKSDILRPLFAAKKGEWYSRKRIDDGRKKSQEIYGSAGYMEFTAFPDITFSDDPTIEDTLANQIPEFLRAPPEPAAGPKPIPVADVTMRIEEGTQYFVNRITFTGNTTTRDNVIRREMRLLEGSVFSTEALKFSVRRLNQLGYFKNLEGNDKDMKVEKTPGKPNAVDVTLKFEEQNRNQLTFGAGVSQYEGVFGQLAFQTSNFLGRGESLTVSMTAGDRSQNYQLGFTEPFLFDRNITGGFDIYKRSLQYIGYYTQKSTGGNLVFGFPVANFSRMFFNYSYETTRIGDLNEALIDQSCLLRSTGCSIISSVGDLSQLTPTQIDILRRNPFVYDSLLVGQGGSRSISKVVPQFVHNTVDNPIFPSTGRRLTAAIDLAMLGGNTKFYKPRIEGVMFFRHTSRTSFGFRGQAEYIAPVGKSSCVVIPPATTCAPSLPIFERLFLGGEYSVRGFDIRSIGPTVPGSPIVLGGNKSLLFNAEYMFSIASQVRIVAFYDAGQVRDFGEKFMWKENLTQTTSIVPPLLDPFATSGLIDPNAPSTRTEIIGRTSAFKTSTGLELRFFMPVLNVPFRLIYSFNPQRGGVLDNNLQPAKDKTFRFAVGTTF
jgi:outer membrane protein insertion porin family